MEIGCQYRVTIAVIESRKPYRVTQATSSHNNIVSILSCESSHIQDTQLNGAHAIFFQGIAH